MDSSFRYIKSTFIISQYPLSFKCRFDIPMWTRNKRQYRVFHICFIFAYSIEQLHRRKLQTNNSALWKRDDFWISFSNVNLQYLWSNISSSPAYGIYASQLIWYARAWSPYEQILNISFWFLAISIAVYWISDKSENVWITGQETAVVVPNPSM